MSVAEDRPLIDVLLVTTDESLRTVVSESRAAGGELLCLSEAELRGRNSLLARQVWVDLDTTPAPDVPVGARRVYFYTDPKSLPSGLPAGLFVRKPCAAVLFEALWADVGGDAGARAGNGGAPALALPAWLMEFDELGADELARRIVRGLPARLGYRQGSLYWHDADAQVLSLAATTHTRPIERLIRLDQPKRYPLALLARRGQVFRTEYAWDEWLRRGIVRPGDFPYADGSCLIAPLSASGEMYGMLCLCERSRVSAPEREDPLREILGFLGRRLRHARLFEAARREARVDPLTGLYNQRWIAESLEREIRRAERYPAPLSVLVVDLDGLKAINDQRGHAAGDAALRHASGQFLKVLRQADGAARIGGDEFCIVLPETNADGAANVGRRLLEAFRETAPELELCGGQLTASIGVAEWQRGMTAGKLTGAADQAMYRAKQAGGNRVVGPLAATSE